ncbi:MAG TPA: hypothetical protein PKL35_06195, partial [Methanoregulaceae archaeon]|nr:hypothetical protein [Methanoregulaceae archaeon]
AGEGQGKGITGDTRNSSLLRDVISADGIYFILIRGLPLSDLAERLEGTTSPERQERGETFLQKAWAKKPACQGKPPLMLQ